MVRTLLKKYAQRLADWIEKGKAAGEIDPSVDSTAACQLFIGAIQGLVMQSLITGESDTMRDKAIRVFTILRQGIEAKS